MMEQNRKQILTIPAMIDRMIGVGAVLFVLMTPSVGASPLNTRFITDPLTGAALDGYDAVSYFTNDQPLHGRPEFELEWMGIPWLFASAANRDVFRDAPEVYAPQFGGYGLMGLARGYLSDGNPRIYAILADRLFLFYSTANRDAFMLSQRAAYEKARATWTERSPTLIGAAGDDGEDAADQAAALTDDGQEPVEAAGAHQSTRAGETAPSATPAGTVASTDSEKSG